MKIRLHLAVIIVLIACGLCLSSGTRAAVPSAGASCTDNTNGATACYLNGCYLCSSGVWVAQPLLVGASASACSSTLTGLIQWTGTSFQGCDGSAWRILDGSTTCTTPAAFNFTDQTGVATSTTITSNTITLSGTGFTCAAMATCSGCINIIRNGVADGTSAIFNSGDTIALQLVSSASFNTAKTATVTIGNTTSSTWTVTTSSNTPAAFAFTDQTGVNTSTEITSNTVTLSGTFSGLTATCGTGCTAISRNGAAFSTSPVSGFQTGDTIAIKQTSASTGTTASTATVTVGGTTSSTWTVTTGANTPDAFAFTDQTGVSLNTEITSNTVTLSGTFSGLTATCGTGCTAISRNGAAFSTSPVSGFQTGDTIAIKQTSASTGTTASTATVTVGGTTSSTWTVTTVAVDPCAGTPSVGTVCTDGTVYAGLSPDGNVAMYTTRCDAGQTWDTSSCTGTRVTKKWSYDETIATGITSTVTGETNTDSLYALNANADGPYEAATYCHDLTQDGHDDWYLPALSELNVLYTGNTAIGNFNTSGLYYWSSTEASYYLAKLEKFSTGGQYSSNKFNTDLVRCVRK